MIKFDGVDFSERRSAEVISFFWRSLQIIILKALSFPAIVKTFPGLCNFSKIHPWGLLHNNFTGEKKKSAYGTVNGKFMLAILPDFFLR